MRTGAILLPLATLLLLPLLVAVLLHAIRLRKWGHPVRWRSRIAWAVGYFMVGVGFTAAVLAGFILRADHCRAEARGALAEADSFIVFSFGLGPPVSGKPTAGESNRDLARWLLEHNPTRKPTIVQEGVYLALEELNAVGDWVIRRSDRPDVYVDTVGAAYQAETVLYLRGLQRPVVVAHDLQLQRAAWSLEAAGVRDFIVPEMPPIPFDANSVQHSGTKYESAWLRRELLFARPITLRPQATIVVLAVIALLYGIAVRTVISARPSSS